MARARALGARGRRFEPCLPDKQKKLTNWSVLRLLLFKFSCQQRFMRGNLAFQQI